MSDLCWLLSVSRIKCLLLWPVSRAGERRDTPGGQVLSAVCCYCLLFLQDQPKLNLAIEVNRWPVNCAWNIWPAFQNSSSLHKKSCVYLSRTKWELCGVRCERELELGNKRMLYISELCTFGVQWHLMTQAFTRCCILPQSAGMWLHRFCLLVIHADFCRFSIGWTRWLFCNFHIFSKC